MSFAFVQGVVGFVVYVWLKAFVVQRLWLWCVMPLFHVRMLGLTEAWIMVWLLREVTGSQDAPVKAKTFVDQEDEDEDTMDDKQFRHLMFTWVFDEILTLGLGYAFHWLTTHT